MGAGCIGAMAEPARNQTLAYLVIALLTAAMIAAAARVVSTTATELLRGQLETFAGEAFDRAEKNLSQGLYRIATAISPENPQLPLFGANLELWENAAPNQSREALDAGRQRALTLQRQAIRRRPAWPYPWMYLAATKLQARELDAEFQHAYAMALRLGPAEPLVEREALEIGLKVWVALSDPNKQRFKAALGRQLARPRHDVFTRAVAMGRLDELCLIAEGEAQVDAYCEQKGI